MAQMQNRRPLRCNWKRCGTKCRCCTNATTSCSRMIQQRGDVEKVSSRNMRFPLQLIPGGKAGSYNADGGDLGRGSGTSYDVAQVSPIFFRFAVEICKLVDYATNAREKAIENAAKREVANGMKQFRAFLDKVIADGGERSAGNDRFGERHHLDDEHASGRGARLRRADDSGVRHDAQHQPRLLQRCRRGSDQPDTDDHRGLVAGRNHRPPT